VFRHKHEILCGKTSSISHQIVGLDEKGKVTNSNEFGGLNDWAQILEKSVKIINFFDMGGSEKSLKTTVKALSKNYLDYIFLVIAANKGITNTTSDFLKIAITMGLPIVTIITKTDMINDEDLGGLLNNFKYILKSEKKGKNPLVVHNKDDIVTFSRNINEGILPVFLISNKKGSGLDLFINFLNLIPVDIKEDLFNLENNFNNSLSPYISNSLSNSSNLNLKRTPSQKNETIFEILEILQVENKLILIGIVTKGVLLRGNQYKLGPDPSGNYKLVNLISIHCKKVEVKSATQGQFCSILLDENATKECVRSGMVLVNAQSNPAATRVFECEVWSIDGKERKIKFSTQPIVHISPIRQSIKIYDTLIKEDGAIKLSCSEEEFLISPNMVTKLYFEFMYVPEYVREGSHLIIYESNFKIFGYVTRIIK
jgi:GTPase